MGFVVRPQQHLVHLLCDFTGCLNTETVVVLGRQETDDAVSGGGTESSSVLNSVLLWQKLSYLHTSVDTAADGSLW